MLRRTYTQDYCQYRFLNRKIYTLNTPIDRSKSIPLGSKTQAQKSWQWPRCKPKHKLCILESTFMQSQIMMQTLCCFTLLIKVIKSFLLLKTTLCSFLGGLYVYNKLFSIFILFNRRMCFIVPVHLLHLAIDRWHPQVKWKRWKGVTGCPSHTPLTRWGNGVLGPLPPVLLSDKSNYFL